jgi:hypothetical protein
MAVKLSSKLPVGASLVFVTCCVVDEACTAKETEFLPLESSSYALRAAKDPCTYTSGQSIKYVLVDE